MGTQTKRPLPSGWKRPAEAIPAPVSLHRSVARQPRIRPVVSGHDHRVAALQRPSEVHRLRPYSFSRYKTLSESGSACQSRIPGPDADPWPPLSNTARPPPPVSVIAGPLPSSVLG